MGSPTARERLCQALKVWQEALGPNTNERLLPLQVWGVLVAICEVAHIETSELIAPMLLAYRESESWTHEHLLGGSQRPGHQITDLRERIAVSLQLLEGAS